MSASRASVTRAFSRVSVGLRQTRRLHITEPSNLPAWTAALDRSPSGLPQDVASLRMECKRQGLPNYGSKFQLMSRLASRGNRAFSTSDSSYGSPQSLGYTSSTVDLITIHQPPPSAQTALSSQSRYFNTSRQLKRVGDSSTIDFAYLPMLYRQSLEPQMEDIRVPLLPQNSRTDGSKAPMASEVADIKHVPVQINVISAESTHLEGGPSAMTDEHAHELDMQGVARQLALGLEREGGEDIRKAKGLMKQVWTGFVDDLFGQKSPKQ